VVLIRAWPFDLECENVVVGMGWRCERDRLAGVVEEAVPYPHGRVGFRELDASYRTAEIVLDRRLLEWEKGARPPASSCDDVAR
jgi:hypothetical protein